MGITAAGHKLHTNNVYSFAVGRARAPTDRPNVEFVLINLVRLPYLFYFVA